MTEHVMAIIRQRNGLDEDDTTQDEKLNAKSPKAKLCDIVGWELGDPSWADTFLYWAQECGYKIEEK
jgi:hypothetical protein